MKRKEQTIEEDDPLDRELTDADFAGAIPNPYAKRYGRNRNLRILAPDLLAIFPDSESVNEALRIIVRAAAATQPQKISAKTAAAPKKKARS